MRAGWLGVCASMLACGVLVAAASDGQDRRSRNRSRTWDNGDDYQFNINTNRDGEPARSCADVDVTVRNGELARSEEVQNFPASAQGLAVSGAKNGPVSVTGADRNDYQVTLCKFTAGNTPDEAQGRLADLSLGVDNGRVTVNGPSDHAYVAYVIVETPRNANLNVDVMNGPLDLRSVSGHIVARTTNGPLAVSDVSGDVDVQATNGPVSLSRGSGNMRVRSQNGPLSVNLSGTDWQGTGLEASAQNGPLYLGVPDDYRSGVLVDISSNSPFHCASSACRGAQRDWDDRSRTLHLGSDPNPIVRVTAKNGPVTIGSGRD